MARARRDTEEAEILDKAKKAKRNRNRNKNKNTDKKMRDRKAGAHKVAGSGSGGSSSVSGSDTRTAQDILNLHWPLEIAAGTAPASSSDEDARREEEGGGREEEEGRRGGKGGGKEAEVGLSLREYVARRQQGSATAKGGDVKQAEEKKAEELRKTAVLGPVLNDGERWACVRVRICAREREQEIEEGGEERERDSNSTFCQRQDIYIQSGEERGCSRQRVRSFDSQVPVFRAAADAKDKEAQRRRKQRGTKPHVIRLYLSGCLFSTRVCDVNPSCSLSLFQRKIVTRVLFNQRYPRQLALPCLALPCLDLPCLALPCLALPCLALPCLASPCLCLALPCLPVSCLALPCLALP